MRCFGSGAVHGTHVHAIPSDAGHERHFSAHDACSRLVAMNEHKDNASTPNERTAASIVEVSDPAVTKTMSRTLDLLCGLAHPWRAGQKVERCCEKRTNSLRCIQHISAQDDLESSREFNCHRGLLTGIPPAQAACPCSLNDDAPTFAPCQVDPNVEDGFGFILKFLTKRCTAFPAWDQST